MDAAIVRWLNGGIGLFPPFDELMRAFVSDYLVPVTLVLVLAGLWFLGHDGAERYRRQLAALTGIAGLGLANLTVEFIITRVFRDRPFVDMPLDLSLFYRPTDSSFPSNPAATGFAVATGVFLWDRRVGAFLYVLAFLWSFARVYAGVHYPTDILGGAAIGIGLALVAGALMRLLEFLPRLVLRLLRLVYLA